MSKRFDSGTYLSCTSLGIIQPNTSVGRTVLVLLVFVIFPFPFDFNFQKEKVRALSFLLESNVNYE